MQLLDAAVVQQVAARTGRARAAHWALCPEPVLCSGQAPAALQLTALVIAAHTTAANGGAEEDGLTHLSALSVRQLEDVLDCLVRGSCMGVWYREPGTGELRWRL
ncbi:hypothetical protein ADK70_13165 [Streptomyces rimosus subsp. pseudoverticillatus]|uniref:hypothetical protein n=1 Tax=Streptomyces rimosus TaxID=1927 RepID=UPI0006B27244|nr:hypothetical protein [Streptomyces rimosus]KOT94037.1 hypothetical protein ADK70_13165 [Streptomyces rimosus subsp. pseudoverticillatus]